ncbi:hypothetical protein TCAL_08012 [Tigriopus californicus]|uniref:GPI mannosyltransferase 2 n=1 Tax=Tigriopus californicus TaxID=6832 RepID=A0A553PIE1_TIGCA|nr:hypothetical protein TCAL_08012 [Tigriopus californicus]|eukprot:TCALIF_08012-PA protein Name:"Similar to Pigv GPI mannosyltransferase 2 (Rattus norvegicus)" AED:0.00 eAED:0.00 QI:204/1/0.75/1/0.66/0.75/4/734/570
MISLRHKVWWWAVYGRGFVITIQILCHLSRPGRPSQAEDDGFQWVQLEPDLPSSPERSSPAPPSFETLIDHFIGFLSEGGIRGDAQHILHVANNGYTFEDQLFVLPLYPLVIQSLAQGSHWLVGDGRWLTYISWLKLMAVMVNGVLFVLAADLLYSLSRRVLQDEYLAYKAALFFCLNPASTYFSAPYTETMYSVFSLGAMLAIDDHLSLKSGVLLALASGTRANGVINIGFVIYKSLTVVSTKTILFVRAKKEHGGPNATQTRVRKPKIYDIFPDLAMQAIIPGIANIILCFAPMVAFQWYAFTTFCDAKREEIHFPAALKNVARNQGYVFPGNLKELPWCQHDPPLSYPWLRPEHWGLGFLTYWEWETKQLWQAALAAPALGLILWQLVAFMKIHKKYALRLGLVDNSLLGIPRLKDPPLTTTWTLPRECFVYIVHSALLAIICLFFNRIQVGTRLICSSSPVLYWIAALLTTPSEDELVPIETGKVNREPLAGSGTDALSPITDKERLREERRVWFRVEKARNLNTRSSTILLQEVIHNEVGNAIKIYFLAYTLVGTVLYSNHFQWS